MFLTGNHLKAQGFQSALDAKNSAELLTVAKNYLHQNKTADFVLFDADCQKKFGAEIYKGVKGYFEYRKIVKYFSASCLIDYCTARGKSAVSRADIAEIMEIPLYAMWINAGGQVMPEEKAFELFDKIKNHEIDSWREVHAFYDDTESHYLEYKTRYALYLLELLYAKQITAFSSEDFADIREDVTRVSDCMYQSSIESREKDYTDYFRKIVYRNDEEMTAVLGTLSDNSFLQEMKESTAEFDAALSRIFSEL